ncbi:glycoside hydrolase, partial [Ramicandelaber brevisporus]
IDRIDFSKLSHVMYAFAIPNADGFINITTIEQHLPKMVSAANSKGAEVSLSIGGWIGSKDISPMIANEKSRSAFIKNAADLADKYGVHLDIDYESPGERSNGDPDNGGTKFDTKHDTDNYLKLLQDLRKELDNRASANGGNKRRTQLSIAAFPHTFLSSDGRTYLNDMTEWAKVVDFVQIMAYDMGSNDPKVIAPHAPFESTDGRTTSSFTQAIDAWTNAKWPANQIVVGIPFYGRSFTAKVDIAKNPNDIYVERSPTIPRGDNDDSENGKPKPPKLKGEFSGVWRYRNLVSQGVLKDANVAGEGWTLGSDKVSKSPFLFNETSKDFITFDSVDSIKAKAAFARKRGIAGVMAW